MFFLIHRVILLFYYIIGFKRKCYLFNFNAKIHPNSEIIIIARHFQIHFQGSIILENNLDLNFLILLFFSNVYGIL